MSAVFPLIVCHLVQRVGQGRFCFPVGCREGEVDIQGECERVVPLEQEAVPETAVNMQ